MLPDLHNAIRRLIHERGKVDPGEVEVLFDAPERVRVDRLTRPAVSFFLTGVQENIELRNASFEATRTTSSSERKLAPRRIDLTYVVTALTTDPDDEHRLLWRTLATLLRHQQIPVELLPEEITRTGVPVTLRTAQPEDNTPSSEIWTGLGLRPRPVISCVVTVPLDLEITIQAPLVLTRTTRYQSGLAPDGPGFTSYINIGGTIRDGDGQPVAGAMISIEGRAGGESISSTTGSYRLFHIAPGPVTLLVTPPDGELRRVTVTVPSDGYDITLD